MRALDDTAVGGHRIFNARPGQSDTPRRARITLHMRFYRRADRVTCVRRRRAVRSAVRRRNIYGNSIAVLTAARRRVKQHRNGRVHRSSRHLHTVLAFRRAGGVKHRKIKIAEAEKETIIYGICTVKKVMFE